MAHSTHKPHTRSRSKFKSSNTEVDRAHEPERLEIRQNIGETHVDCSVFYVHKYRIILTFCCGDKQNSETATETVSRR